ncbi:unnamed protein product [Clonostachys rosea f. rosea IK726]|uniref:Uncharacterized protein n=1 Tax=Clonostachys rosea f. rosea IK726 TaxID=1349383 RepID=A0ACA9UHQ1_BIOOC|nr:unnamed protein product [Clonostachys rosea f. rosea IK726]
MTDAMSRGLESRKYAFGGLLPPFYRHMATIQPCMVTFEAFIALHGLDAESLVKEEYSIKLPTSGEILRIADRYTWVKALETLHRQVQAIQQPSVIEVQVGPRRLLASNHTTTLYQMRPYSESHMVHEPQDSWPAWDEDLGDDINYFATGTYTAIIAGVASNKQHVSTLAPDHTWAPSLMLTPWLTSIDVFLGANGLKEHGAEQHGAAAPILEVQLPAKDEDAPEAFVVHDQSDWLYAMMYLTVVLESNANQSGGPTSGGEERGRSGSHFRITVNHTASTSAKGSPEKNDGEAPGYSVSTQAQEGDHEATIIDSGPEGYAGDGEAPSHSVSTQAQEGAHEATIIDSGPEGYAGDGEAPSHSVSTQAQEGAHEATIIDSGPEGYAEDGNTGPLARVLDTGRGDSSQQEINHNDTSHDEDEDMWDAKDEEEEEVQNEKGANDNIRSPTPPQRT